MITVTAFWWGVLVGVAVGFYLFQEPRAAYRSLYERARL